MAVLKALPLMNNGASVILRVSGNWEKRYLKLRDLRCNESSLALV